MKPKAILFDMDGVIVDSLDAWWHSLNHALEKHNMKSISKKMFIEKYWGHDLYENLKRNNLPLKVGMFCNQIYGNYLNSVKIFENVSDVLEKLSVYNKCVVTNTPRDCTTQILKKFGLEKYFKFVFTSNDVKLAKPDPEIILLACRRLGVKPEYVVLVGDTDSDIKAGHAAGCKVIGVGIKADYFINDISEIFDILQK
jgi:HAD superfamily hydrolase (TIGR01509 family)